MRGSRPANLAPAGCLAAPVFTKHITVSHCFERLQRIRVALFDVDSKKKAHKIDLGGDTDFLGNQAAPSRWRWSPADFQVLPCLACGHALTCTHLPAAHAEFVLADLLSAQGRKLTLPTADKHGRLQPGCTVTLSAEELPNSNAVVSRKGTAVVPDRALARARE